MTDNLRLVGSRTLTSTNSDVTSNYTLPASSTSGWCTDNTTACYNKENVLSSGSSTYGAYYSWKAATAGTGGTSGMAPSSICPKGWKLADGNEYYNLVSSHYSAPGYLMSAPASQVLSGNRTGSTTSVQGEEGWYWTRNIVDTDYVYFYQITPGGATVTYSGYFRRWGGAAVRCTAR